jgi:hypothetical protein
MVKKVKDAGLGPDGTISSVTLAGNKNPTPIETAIRMAERGQLEGVHVVTKRDGSKYLRGNPDKTEKNNLLELAKD